MQLDYVRPQALGSLPPGEPGTRDTLRLMSMLTRRGKVSGLVRQTALSLIADLPPKQWAREVRAVFDFVRDRVRYVRDIAGVETVQTPEVTLDLLAGDCDDKSVLLAALLESIGHPTRFIAVGYQSPGNYSHVYVETRVGARWVALDSTMPHEAGWAPRASIARMTLHN